VGNYVTNTRPDLGNYMTADTGRLLRPPTPHHRLDHRVLGPQLPHTINQFCTRRARQTNPSQHGPTFR